MGIQRNLNPSPISNLNCNSLFCSQFSFMIFPFPVICSPNPYSPLPVLATPKLQSSGLQLKAFTLPYAKGQFGHAIIKNIHVCLSYVEPRIILQCCKTHTVFYFSILQRCYVLLEDFHLSSIAKGASEECNITFVMHVTREWDKRRNISPSLVHTDS